MMSVLILIVVVVGFVVVLAAIDGIKCAILKAIGERVDPARTKKMTDDLREHTDPLVKAVEANKPLSD